MQIGIQQVYFLFAATQLWRLKIADIAQQYTPKFHFAIADEEEQSQLFQGFGFDDSAGEMM